MKQWILAGAVAVAAVAARPPIEDDGQARVQLVGLQVVKPLPGDQRKQSLTGRRIGTALTVKVSRPDQHFLGLDKAASRLEAFTDDRNMSLTTESAKLLRTWLDGQTWVSRDGDTCIFEVLSDKAPSPRARQVKFKGRIGLLCGRDGLTVEQPGFRLAKDGRLSVGPAPMKITGVQRGDKTTIFTLSTKKKPERIACIRFFDDGGKELDTKVLEKAVVGFMGQTYHDWTYCLKTAKPRRLDTVTARVLYFNKVRTIIVPVEIAAGVGL